MPAKKRVLIVDDVSSNRKLLSVFMADLGFDVLFAEDGLQTLEILEKEMVHLIIMDLNMPRLDGMSTIEKIRTRDWDRREIPIIVVTAFGSKKTREKGFLVGVNEMMLKPVDFPELEKKIRSFGLIK